MESQRLSMDFWLCRGVASFNPLLTCLRVRCVLLWNDTLDYNSLLLYFGSQIVPTFSTESSSSCLLCPFDMPTYPILLFFKDSLTLWHCKIFQFLLYFPCPIPRSAVSLRIPGSFYFTMILETKIWPVSVLIATGCHYF